MTLLHRLWTRLRRGASLDCREVAALMQAYLDGELPQDQTDLVAQHLASCRACGIEEETFRAVKHALAAQRPDLDVEALARLDASIERIVGTDGTAR
jgi:anti-sigma factor RsiW